MPVDTWFPLAIYYEDLPDAQAHRASLLAAVLESEQAVTERRNFPEMAWTGDLHGVHQLHTDPRFAWIVAQVEVHTQTYLQALGLDLSQVDLHIQRAWPVVSRHQQEVGIHCHNTAHISAVYYIAVPASGTDESGCLVFFDDARMNEVSPGIGSENTNVIAMWNVLNQDQALYSPLEGRLIIFPAKQRHGVTMNHTEDLRVSISFDIVMTAAPGTAAGTYEFLMPPPSQWQTFRHRI
ncbi:MAG: TIGR02466 family protein [Cyanobacteria bacterium P01_H01_bin.58]